MPAPAALAPIAIRVAQIGVVAAVGWYVARRARPSGPREIWREQALNDVEEGVSGDVTRDGGETRADGSARFRRTVRLGADGPGLDIDLSALGRLRVRRV